MKAPLPGGNQSLQETEPQSGQQGQGRQQKHKVMLPEVKSGTHAEK